MIRLVASALISLAALALSACSGSSTGSTGGIAVAGSSCQNDGSQAAATDGCNLCQCRAGSWECTAEDCTSECATGQERRDGCNVCVCGDGKWSCTRATCGVVQCSAGETRSDGCNTCSCQGGQWSCTQMDCSEPCVEGQTNDAGDGCNSCTCSGGTWQCTNAECGGICEDGTETSDGCNTCVCSGGNWQCTDAYCPPVECTDGQTRSGECELCTCEGGQWLCTGTPCAQPACPAPTPTEPGIACTAVIAYARDPDTGNCCEYPDPCSAPAGWEQYGSYAACIDASVACVPGETQRAGDGCNVCTCSAIGQWACQEIGCIGPVACGGMAGDTCTDDEFCAYTPGLLCGAADAQATCEPRPEGCDLIYDPVCGCDNQPYDNACSAAMAGVGVLAPGPCTTDA